jgi:multidrug efflux pump subunit AcrB
MRDGHTRLEATLKATQQIGLAVVGCTATLIIAFLPLVFLPEGSGEFIRSLPMGVITSVLASMVVSLTIIPFLSSRLLKENHGHPDGNIFMRGLKKIIHGSYSILLDKALAKPWWTIGVAAVIFIGSLQLFPMIGFSLFPASEKPQFLIEITTPLQSNLNYTDSITREVEHELSKHAAITHFATNVGKGNPRIYYNVIPENERTDYTQIFVQLDEQTSTQEKLTLIEELRSKWNPYPGAKVEVKNFEQGPPINAPLEVRVFGDNLDSLRSIASRVENLLQQTKGTI